MSTIIIRLQNLPLSAKAHDIRDFFGDLKIPKGSVNIVGGSNGDAFIGFQTDEDARLAMLLDGRLLHQAKIRLMLSSRREMEQVIADAQALAGAAKQQQQSGGGVAAVQHQLAAHHQQTAAVEVKGGALEEKSAKLSADQQSSAKDGGGGQWKSEIEVPVPAISSSASQSAATFATQQTTAAAPSYQQLFGGDSWKNPQLAPSSQQLAASAAAAASCHGSQQSHHHLLHQQEQVAPTAGSQPHAPAAPPVFPGSAHNQPPSFGGGVPPSSLGLLVGSPNKTQQQMPNIPQQPPGFPPPLNLPSQPLQTAAGVPQQQPRPLPPYVGGDGFFNQQTPAAGYHTQRFSAQHVPAYVHPQNFRPGQVAPHQNQFGMPTQGAGQFRPSRPPFGRRGGGPPLVQQQQQFGGAPPHGGGMGAFPTAYGAESKSVVGGGAHFQQQQHFQPRPHQYQQRFEGRPAAVVAGGGGINGAKRRRSRSPPGAAGPEKRCFYHEPSSLGNENIPSALFPPTFIPSTEPPVKERVCVQLSNVPYKATFFDVKQYLSSTNAECVKVTRVYQPDRNYSDRWIVEFDNEKDARSVIRHHGEINNRTIRTERIPARKADEQYAVTEPDDKDRGEKRSSDEPGGRRERGDRGGRGDRDGRRDRERDRGTSNRSRSPPRGGRGGRGRSSDQSRSSHSDKGGGGGNSSSATASASLITNTTTAASATSTSTTTTAVWAKEEQQQQRTTKPSSGGDEKKEEATAAVDRDRQAQQQQRQQQHLTQQHQQQQLAMMDSLATSSIGGGPLNLISNAAVFGAFSFPDSHNNNNANYRQRTGGVAAAQLGTKTNEPKPLRAFEFFPAPPAAGPTHRPPIPLNHLEGGGGAVPPGRPTSPPTIGHQQQQAAATSLIGHHHIPSLIRPTTSASSNTGFWPRQQTNAAAAVPPGAARQQITGPSSFVNPALQQHVQSINLGRTGAVKPSVASSFNVSVSGSLDTSIGSTVAGLVIQEDYSMDEADSDNDARLLTETTTPTKSAADSLLLKSTPFAALSSGGNPQNGGLLPDQPPLDLLEPENDALSSLHHAVQAKHQHANALDKRAFDSVTNREFTGQELELRPHLSFLERYREDPNLSSCIRLENVPKMVYAEQLAEFLGVQFDSPYENIARMQNGVLYINLPNEAMATKAASQNMRMLNGHQIVITQLKRVEMADSIRQNMIIIREMCRVSVVVRGFPLVTQLNEVVALFDRFHLNRDGAEKCTVKPNDTVSTFLLTFASAKDCRDAIREMNDTQIAAGVRIKVFQPTDVNA